MYAILPVIVGTPILPRIATPMAAVADRAAQVVRVTAIATTAHGAIPTTTNAPIRIRKVKPAEAAALPVCIAWMAIAVIANAMACASPAILVAP